MSRKKQNSSRQVLARAGWIILGAIILFVLLIEKEQLPASLQNNNVVIDLYAKRDRFMHKAEPAPVSVTTQNPGQGYSDKDRSKMDQLITRDVKPSESGAGKATSGAAQDH